MKRIIQGIAVIFTAVICATVAQAAVAPKLTCTMPKIAIASNLSKVSATATCRLAGRLVRPSFSWRYTEFDPFGNACRATVAGTLVSGKSTSFIPRLPDAYSLSTSFTVNVTQKGRLFRGTSASAKRVATSRTLDCGLRPPVDPPASQLCDYPFKNGNQCGVPITSSAGPIPIWTGKPFRTGNVIYAPPLAQDSGLCRQVPVGQPVMWLGALQQPAYWHCSDGTRVTPRAFVYLAPSNNWNGSDICDSHGSMPANGEFTQLTIPAGWGGQIAVEYGLTFTSRTGEPAQVWEYADMIGSLPGNTDGCTDLTAQPTKP